MPSFAKTPPLHAPLGNDSAHVQLGNDSAHVRLGNDSAHVRLGNDSARVQLRNTLTTYLHGLDPPAPTGYHRWVSAGLVAAPTPTLLVGDPIALAVSPRPA